MKAANPISLVRFGQIGPVSKEAGPFSLADPEHLEFRSIRNCLLSDLTALFANRGVDNARVRQIQAELPRTTESHSE
jgi:hypothetical protein